MEAHEIIKRPLHTEKSVRSIQASNTYHFEVDTRANKSQVRMAVEQLYPDVRVTSVRTMRTPGKTRRRGWLRGRTPEVKKAVVTIRSGDSIDIGY